MDSHFLKKVICFFFFLKICETEEEFFISLETSFGVVVSFEGLKASVFSLSTWYPWQTENE